jgi:hypothetical protein
LGNTVTLIDPDAVGRMKNLMVGAVILRSEATKNPLVREYHWQQSTTGHDEEITDCKTRAFKKVQLIVVIITSNKNTIHYYLMQSFK